ncbi:MAG TPA: hypothetical protein ENK21_06435 [Trueperaceae bacterium]|nr:hypothetical protein [Trueperaceae bacterium]
MHLRIPWGMLGVGDPSQKYIYDGHEANLVRQIEDIGIKVVSANDSLDARFNWDKWEQPSYVLEPKPLYYSLKELWAE